MPLPKGWDSELETLDARLRGVIAKRKAMIEEMDSELARVRGEFGEKMPHAEIAQLTSQIKDAWGQVRGTYPIEHPERKSRFRYSDDAAAVLAHYWQGEEMPHEKLVRAISGGNHKINQRAYEFAVNLTEPGSPERKYVESAQKFLWKDVGREF